MVYDSDYLVYTFEEQSMNEDMHIKLRRQLCELS